MTNEQKAEVIAVWDGWVKNGICYTNPTTNEGLIQPIAENYLTDLNYLVPIAVKVFNEIGKIHTAGACLMCNHLAKSLWETPEGTYQPLFDAVYNAIVYLENQKA